MGGGRLRRFGWALGLACTPATALAAEPAHTVPEVVVTAASPLDTAGLDRDLVPAASSALASQDISRTGAADLLGALDRTLGPVSLAQAQGNPFQPNLTYRGFEASPLAGDAQGLAVYVGGARFNQPFGDTVDWDLIPDAAIQRAELVGSNPVFGLNALGGAVAVRLKDGFSFSGGEAEASGGSFGRGQGQLQLGAKAGGFAVYAALAGLHEDGWRDASPSTLRQGYLDLGWRGGRAEAHLSVLAADNDLTGNGSAPVELLAARRSAIFTSPDATRNRYLRLLATGGYDLRGGWRLEADAYAAWLDKRTLNGDAADAQPCSADPSILCDEDDAALADIAGHDVPNVVHSGAYAAAFPQFAAGGPYAVLNRARTRTSSYGGALELSGAPRVGGRPNHLTVGVSFDGARTRFAASTLIGALTLERSFAGPGVELDLPDGSIAPLGVKVTNAYWGVYLHDTYELTDAVALTLSGRFNAAHLRLDDQLGTALDGSHDFHRFNPAAGLTWKLTPGLSAYAGYAEASRAPTPAELSCADPAAPCSLANFFVGDPDLKQVTSRTYEGGVRGRVALGAATAAWRLGVFRIDTANDIQMVASSVSGRGFFTNVGETRRQGVEAELTARRGRFSGYTSLAWIDAAYRTGFVLNAGLNAAFADPADTMVVVPGDKRPGVPPYSVKVGLDYEEADGWRLGASLKAEGGRYFLGDEANLDPRTGAYALVEVHAARRLAKGLEAFAAVQNLFDRRYATFGTFSPVEDVPVIELPAISDRRSLSPGAPINLQAGLRLSF